MIKHRCIQVMAYYKWVELTVDKGGCWALAEVCDRKHFYAEREPYWGFFLALLQVLKSLLYMFFFMMQKQLKKALHKMNKIIVTMYIYTQEDIWQLNIISLSHCAALITFLHVYAIKRTIKHISCPLMTVCYRHRIYISLHTNTRKKWQLHTDKTNRSWPLTPVIWLIPFHSRSKWSEVLNGSWWLRFGLLEAAHPNSQSTAN